MNTQLARLLTLLYPRPWRERYGAEFRQLLQDGHFGPRALFNVLGTAVREHLFPTTHAAGATAGTSVLALARCPSALAPMLLSVAALLFLAGFLLLASRGVVPLHTADGDEGFAAHFWQLLIVIQFPIIGWFALRHFWHRPVQTLVILGVHAMLALASIIPILVMES